MAGATRSAASHVGRPTRGGTSAAIDEAAVSLFYAHGYHATSLRSIAAAVGIQVGSLYNHIPSKEALLSRVVLRTAADLRRTVEEAYDGVRDPRRRLELGIEQHVRFHLEHHRAVVVMGSETRVLTAADRDAALALSADYDDLLTALIAAADVRRPVLEARLLASVARTFATTLASRAEDDDGGSVDRTVGICTSLILRDLGLRGGPTGTVTTLPARREGRARTGPAAPVRTAAAS